MITFCSENQFMNPLWSWKTSPITACSRHQQMVSHWRSCLGKGGEFWIAVGFNFWVFLYLYIILHWYILIFHINTYFTVFWLFGASWGITDNISCRRCMSHTRLLLRTFPPCHYQGAEKGTLQNFCPNCHSAEQDADLKTSMAISDWQYPSVSELQMLLGWTQQ